MSISRRSAVFGLLASALASCSRGFDMYKGPRVTRVVVHKRLRRMDLLHGRQLLKSYPIGLGFAPVGHKRIEGDGKTPEGHYMIDRRNPESKFFLSLGINYPNAQDRAEAAKLGKSPGGDIVIHGRGTLTNVFRDWTWGCIALTNKDMKEVYVMVRTGTPISIYP